MQVNPLVHALISAAAVYVPAYVMKSTLTMTILISSAVMVISSFVLKVSGSSPGGATILAIAGIVPLFLVGYKFGLIGVLAYIGAGIAAAFVTVGLERIL